MMCVGGLALPPRVVEGDLILEIKHRLTQT